MKPCLSLLILLGLLSSLSCVQKHEDQKRASAMQNELQAIRATIDSLNVKMEQAALTNDYDTQLSLVTDDVLIDHPLDPPVRGKAALRELQKRGEREGFRYRSYSGTTQEFWVCGERVYERGTWGMSFTTNTIKRPVAPYGSYFQIWTKQGGNTYRIQYVIMSLDMNPYEPET